jgi:5-formyltetrahydrofolate cyclo-ligase
MIDDPKPALRQIARAARRDFVASLSLAAREAAGRALAEAIAPLLIGFRNPASYAAVGDEIDPQWIEKRIGPHAFPRINGRNISFHRTTWAEMRPGPLKIPEPPPNSPEITPDLLLVPLLAVTPAGIRLGQGGGYYDRALAGLRSTGPVMAIGLAWDVQIVHALPRDPWDQLLDHIATPTRLVDCRALR